MTRVLICRQIEVSPECGSFLEEFRCFTELPTYGTGVPLAFYDEREIKNERLREQV